MPDALAHVPLFRTLTVATRKKLSDHAQWRRLHKGEVLFEEGQPVTSVWVIQQGWVYLMTHTPRGIPVTIFTVTPEEVLCGFSAVVGQGSYYASAVAATNTTALCVPHTDFVWLLSHQPGFAEKVLAIYHTRMRHMAEAISLAQAPVAQRLAYVLLRLRATFGNTIPVTHQELSHMAGTRWETSIRTLSAMKRNGWITLSRGKMTVVLPQKLRTLLDERRAGSPSQRPAS